MFEIVGGYLMDKTLERVSSAIKSGVIERWSRRRATEFIKTFCLAVAKGSEQTEVADKLEQVIADPLKSEILFDAYRRVAISASAELGPRIIALVTAKIVGESRDVTPTEEQLLAVAERLTDAELREAKEWFVNHVSKLPKSRAYCEKGEPDDVISTDLWEGWGSFAAKMGQLGLITQAIRVVDRTQQVGRLRATRPPSLVSDIYYDLAYEQLANYIAQADSPQAE